MNAISNHLNIYFQVMTIWEVQTWKIFYVEYYRRNLWLIIMIYLWLAMSSKPFLIEP